MDIGREGERGRGEGRGVRGARVYLLDLEWSPYEPGR